MREEERGAEDRQERPAAGIRSEYLITCQRRLTEDVLELRLAGDTRRITAPGQFVNLELPGFFLRRPLSVSDWDREGLTLVYRIVGRGTWQLAQMAPGRKLDLLSGLGNGFSLAEIKPGARTLVAGGGLGTPPLLALTGALARAGAPPLVLLGFNSAAEVFYEDKFRKAGAAEVLITTMDGSRGRRGLVTDALKEAGTVERYFACGPLPMLKALRQSLAQVPGQLSLEARMGCGFGACMGCSIETRSGTKRICREGPVFTGEELLW